MKIFKILFQVIIYLIILFAHYVLFWPVPFEMESWKPQKSPIEEPRYQVNGKLEEIERLPIGVGVGPASIATDSMGRLYTGLRNGIIIRFDTTGMIEYYGKSYSSAMGISFDHEQNLVIADRENGLVRLKPNGKLETVLHDYQGKPYTFINDVKVGSNGNYYFTESSTQYTMEESESIYFAHSNTGRLFVYDVAKQETQLLLDSLHFPYGLDIDEENDCLLISETTRHQVLRYYFRSDKVGQYDHLIQNLPGYPTGISRSEDGLIWVALSRPRYKKLDWTLNRPFFRKILWRMTRLLKTVPRHYSYVLGISPKGEVVYDLQDSSEYAYGAITSIKEVGDVLYLSGGFETLLESSIAWKTNPRD